jgi:hypothetical protein
VAQRRAAEFEPARSVCGRVLRAIVSIGFANRSQRHPPKASQKVHRRCLTIEISIHASLARGGSIGPERTRHGGGFHYRAITSSIVPPGFFASKSRRRLDHGRGHIGTIARNARIKRVTNHASRVSDYDSRSAQFYPSLRAE